MSHVKAGGSSKNIHNNAGQRLGVKVFGGQKVSAGQVIVRQKARRLHHRLGRQRWRRQICSP